MKHVKKSEGDTLSVPWQKIFCLQLYEKETPTKEFSRKFWKIWADEV